jgi:hypothetical protein
MKKILAENWSLFIELIRKWFERYHLIPFKVYKSAELGCLQYLYRIKWIKNLWWIKD